MLLDESFDRTQLSQAGPSKVSQTANSNKFQANLESSNIDKVINNDALSSNRKRNHKELYSHSTLNNSKKRSYEELFEDISDFLERNISETGMISNYKSSYISDVLKN